MAYSHTIKDPKVGLVLSGGGARAAYQVGVLQAIAELWPKSAGNPFPIISGTSAGAVNGAVLALHGACFRLGVRRMARVWRDFHVEQIFRTDIPGITVSGAHWVAAMLLGGLGRYNPYSLLDRGPLEALLRENVPCEVIQGAIEVGALHAYSVTASCYTTGQSITFFQGSRAIEPWQRARRIGIRSQISVEHLLASAAIPFVFPAVSIEDQYFADGSMRQIAPVSPALHMGAEKVLVIGVRHESEEHASAVEPQDYPNMADVAGYVLDSVFLDSLEADLERLQRINKTLSLIPTRHLAQHGVSLRPVECLVISPSEDIEAIATQHRSELPATTRLLLRGVGAIKRHGGSLISYLLFEKGYCRELMALGYKDTMRRKDEVMTFLGQDAGVEQPAAEKAAAG
jgi:NTE family protein